MKKLILLSGLLISFSSFAQTYNVKKNIDGTVTVTNQNNAYSNPKIINDNSAQSWNNAVQKNNIAMNNMIKNMAASGAFKTARQKAEDIISLKEKNINKYKYIVVAKIAASKEKEIPKIKKVIIEDLSKTNFIIILRCWVHL